MSFSAEQIEQLAFAYAEVDEKHDRLALVYLGRHYENNDAYEYGCHGFARRMFLLFHCIRRVYEILPPTLVEPPEQEQRQDATAYLQAFVLNAFGAIDNLAWTLISERGRPVARNGALIDDRQVGLRAHHVLVRRSTSPDFQAFITQYDSWLEYLTGFRDALAHRIPLYIPPHTILPANIEAYRRLENEMTQAAMRGDTLLIERLSREQHELVGFMPVMRHSIMHGENRAVPFHIQMLADFNTVESIGERLLAELERHD